jgi:hypothetical protein
MKTNPNINLLREVTTSTSTTNNNNNKLLHRRIKLKSYKLCPTKANHIIKQNKKNNDGDGGVFPLTLFFVYHIINLVIVVLFFLVEIIYLT